MGTPSGSETPWAATAPRSGSVRPSSSARSPTTTDQPSIDVLLRAATGDEDAQVRGGAVDALDEIGEAALEQLLSELTGTKGSEAEWVTARKFARALPADRPELRMAAANALGRPTRRRERSPAPRRGARRRGRPRQAPGVSGLRDLRRSACNPGLTERLDDEPRVRRAAAANALGNIGTDRALSPLLDLLDDADESLRRIAAGALGKANNPEPVEPLARARRRERGSAQRRGVLDHRAALERTDSAEPRGPRSSRLRAEAGRRRDGRRAAGRDPHRRPTEPPATERGVDPRPRRRTGVDGRSRGARGRARGRRRAPRSSRPPASRASAGRSSRTASSTGSEPNTRGRPGEGGVRARSGGWTGDAQPARRVH